MRYKNLGFPLFWHHSKCTVLVFNNHFEIVWFSSFSENKTFHKSFLRILVEYLLFHYGNKLYIHLRFSFTIVNSITIFGNIIYFTEFWNSGFLIISVSLCSSLKFTFSTFHILKRPQLTFTAFYFQN